MTLREYISFWQETYDRHQSRPTTYAAHNYVFKNHILPGLGDIPLSELTSKMVGEFLEERKRFGNHRRSGFGLGEETMRQIPYDEEKAVYWLTRSAEQDNQYAQYLLDHLEENRPPSAMLAVTQLLHHMSRIFRDNSVPKSRPGGIQIDRKRLKKLQEKRIALGHKPDDHEEQRPDMTM